MCSNSPNRMSNTFMDNSKTVLSGSRSTFIEDSITPVDVPAVLPGCPTRYIDNSINQDDVPAVLTGSPAPFKRFHNSSGCSNSPNQSYSTLIDDFITPADVPAVPIGPPALL